MPYQPLQDELDKIADKTSKNVSDLSKLPYAVGAWARRMFDEGTSYVVKGMKKLILDQVISYGVGTTEKEKAIIRKIFSDAVDLLEKRHPELHDQLYTYLTKFTTVYPNMDGTPGGKERAKILLSTHDITISHGTILKNGQASYSPHSNFMCLHLSTRSSASFVAGLLAELVVSSRNCDDMYGKYTHRFSHENFDRSYAEYLVPGTSNPEFGLAVTAPLPIRNKEQYDLCLKAAKETYQHIRKMKEHILSTGAIPEGLTEKDLLQLPHFTDSTHKSVFKELWSRDSFERLEEKVMPFIRFPNRPNTHVKVTPTAPESFEISAADRKRTVRAWTNFFIIVSHIEGAMLSAHTAMQEKTSKRHTVVERRVAEYIFMEAIARTLEPMPAICRVTPWQAASDNLKAGVARRDEEYRNPFRSPVQQARVGAAR